MRVFLCSLVFLLVGSAPLRAADEINKLVALVDYIGGDYKNAVASGKVINQLEYDEMLEFSTRALEIFGNVKAAEGGDKAGIEPQLREIAVHIKQKSGEQAVPRLANQVKERLIRTYNIVTYPKSLPDLEAGRIVYAENCAQCHGETGRGDGPGAESMQPKEPTPANFQDPELMSGLSPFKAFNTTTFGIEGTAMPSFSALGEEARWQVAFYVLSLRFQHEASARGAKLAASTKLPEQLTRVDTLATRTDEELGEELSRLFKRHSDTAAVLAYLRKGLLQDRRPDPLLAARAFLAQAVDLYEQGKRQEAYQKAVDAYLDGFELAEPALFSKDASLGREIESRFTEFRGAIRSGANPARIRELHTALDQKLEHVTRILSGSGTASEAYTLFNAALIIVREGVEAALIVSAIIAVLKATGALDAVRYIHLGWALALLSGIATWFVAQTVLTVGGAEREVIEGFTAILAALVLFSVSYWLISKAEAKRWQRYIQQKVKEALTARRVAALVGVSFLAVYREAFETVLFYQALWLQSPTAHGFVIGGFFLGVAILAVLVALIFKAGVKMPLRLFFGLSSALLYLLAFVFLGEGIKDLQATGWFSETPLAHAPELPWFGIYPTLETLLAQSLLLLAALAALFWLWRESSLEEAPKRA
ncbi:MAG TPA: cytochrome c/FTR1 family iron permease [Candidatus Eisenbacteria bacterium]|nr:cytochrome c/FTR1 family iron permease [Candidatus Eisenbacteria bacterium]